LFSGGSIGFYSGDMRLFNDDIRLLKPTMIPAVPNVLNRMYDKVSQRLKQQQTQLRIK
jgi:long-chain acyl-CoA synthetase